MFDALTGCSIWTNRSKEPIRGNESDHPTPQVCVLVPLSHSPPAAAASGSTATAGESVSLWLLKEFTV